MRLSLFTTFIFLTTLTVSNIVPAFGISSIYTESKLFNGTDYIYRCEKLGSVIALYNDSNKYTKCALRYKDSSLVKDMNILSGETIVIEEDTMKSYIMDIIAENLTLSQIGQINNFGDIYIRDILIGLYFNPDTGRILEVDFTYDARTPWASIPVSVFRNIEQSLKRRIHITFNDIGKSFLFATLSMTIYYIYILNKVH